MVQVVAIVTKNIPQATTNFEMFQETPKVQPIACKQSTRDLNKTFECSVPTMDNINPRSSHNVQVCAFLLQYAQTKWPKFVFDWELNKVLWSSRFKLNV